MSKPMIRHCRNCEYFNPNAGYFDCKVRYKNILFERLQAWLCKFYKEIVADSE